MSSLFRSYSQNGEPDKHLREQINKMLESIFGIDTVSGAAMWRVSWSEDQFEKRLGTYEDYTPAGLYIRTVTEVREVPKYRQWIQKKYVLENLVGIPVQNRADLPETKMSYEPLFVFETGQNKYLPPSYAAAEFVIHSIYAAKGQGSLAHYKDPLADGNNGVEARNQRINKLSEELFGDESGLGGAIVHKEGVAGFYPEGKATKAN